MSSNRVQLLFYGEVLVAELRNSYLHQTTHIADYDLKIDGGQSDPVRRRIRGFVDACLEHCRIHDEGLANDIDDLTTLEPFEDVINSENWMVKSPGRTIQVADAPLFSNDGQVSYVLRDV
jgi:hypothetical protein